MRFNQLLIGVAMAALAVSAAAQDMPSDPPGQSNSTKSGLSDLSDTVNQLSDAQPAGVEPDTETDSAASDQASTEPEPQSEPAAEEEATADESGAAPEQPQEPAAEQASEPSGPPPELNAEQRTQLERAGRRGRQLTSLARVGMLASQDMLSRVADPDAAGISGWVAEPEGNAMAVTFYADSDAGPAAVYRVRVLGGRTVSRETFLTGDRPALAGTALRMARARAASESEEERSCTAQPFNVLVVPPASADAAIDVYRITPPESRGRIPVGGHFRATVAADGEVAERHSFSRGCLNVDAGEVATGVRPPPIAITHLTSDMPTEIHVFLSLSTGRPFIIASGDPVRLFAVAGDEVREIPR